jgi:purine-cytosine permease-like protein
VDSWSTTIIELYNIQMDIDDIIDEFAKHNHRLNLIVSNIAFVCLHTFRRVKLQSARVIQLDEFLDFFATDIISFALFCSFIQLVQHCI